MFIIYDFFGTPNRSPAMELNSIHLRTHITQAWHERLPVIVDNCLTQIDFSTIPQDHETNCSHCFSK